MDLEEFKTAFLKEAAKNGISLIASQLEQDAVNIFEELETGQLKPLWQQYHDIEGDNASQITLLRKIDDIQQKTIQEAFSFSTSAFSNAVPVPPLPNTVSFSAATAQMGRPYMEDMWEVVKQGLRLSSDQVPNTTRFFLAFVCDGHGGDACAKFLTANFRPLLEKTAQAMGKKNLDIGIALAHTISLLSDKWDKSATSDESGSTLCGVLIDRLESVAYAFNLGDSRLTIFNDTTKKIIFKTKDHELEDPAEQDRIGGLISTESGSSCQIISVKGDTARLQGLVAMSRAMGDNNPDILGCMSHTPDITKISLRDLPSLTFLIGSDGLYDYLNEALIGKLLYSQIYPQKQGAKAFIEMITAANKKTKGVDNCTVLLVKCTSSP